MKRIAILIVALAASALAAACYWDYDTLREEAKGNLNAVDAIVGRVRRFPPTYYEKRIEIATPKANQGDFDAYDSIAVAYSRLGKQDEAIQWIREKRAAMKAAPARASKEVQYRTESNEGTFWLVKWLSAKPDERKKAWLETSRTQIAQALAIDPNAHFGREQVQLDYIDYCLNPKEDETFQQFARAKIATGGHRAPSFEEETKRQEGVIGLIVLGAAWENPDIIAAIPREGGPPEKNDSTFVDLANERIGELTGLPVPSEPVIQKPWSYTKWMSANEASNKANYKILRENAKQFQAHLSEFVTRRVKEGLHPDKDGDRFWDGYKPLARAELVGPKVNMTGWLARNPIAVVAIVLVILVAAAALLLTVIKKLGALLRGQP